METSTLELSREHQEGGLARPIEEWTAKLPSDTFLWLAGGSILTSLTLRIMGHRHDALFVGQWAPTFLLLGVYNKIVKVSGHDRIEGGMQDSLRLSETRIIIPRIRSPGCGGFCFSPGDAGLLE